MKRTRALNFSNDEIINLLALVETYPVVENKKIDAASVKEKCEAWQKLCQEYNAKTPDCPRTAENLFACYKNLKNRANRKLSTDNTVVKSETPVQTLSNTVIVKVETSDPLYTETSGDTECMTDEQDSTPPEKQMYPMEYLQQVQMCRKEKKRYTLASG